ncbi:shikimate kinase [Chloroflexota bacterium]
MKSSIALIGFMGTGKTAVGKALAEKLGKKFLEMDARIEKKAGKTIPEIFRDDGEISFRELEIEVAGEVAGRKNAVIACGGGVVLNKINIDRLKQAAIVVYLTANPEIILKRTSADATDRPLLQTPDQLSRIKDLLRFRKPFYERAADIEIDTSMLDIDTVAEQIIKNLKGNESLTA